MEGWLLALLALAATLILVLLVKLYLLRKSAREIAGGLKERLASDTNTLLDLSSRDRQMRQLADSLNEQLRLLRRKRQLFQQGDQELKEAVANISHDLRTPLTAISGYLELLEREPLGEQAGRYLRQIQSRLDAMKQLTEELFRYSVMTSVQEIEPQETDLRRMLEETLLSFYGAFRQRGITPEIRLPEQPVRRMLDPNAAGRIFGNIISNALKYSDGDLLVTLSPSGTVRFSNTARDLTAVAAGRLFDRFYTVETARRSTGLGLSIARLLTERMGGQIGAAYHGHTLTITVSFPSGS